MAFKPTRRKKHNTFQKGELNLNSMMDMMTIILLFLLKTYSTSGVIVTPSENLELPSSIAKTPPVKDVNVSITRDFILVNEDPVMSINQIPQDQMLLPGLYNRLLKEAEKQKELEAEVGVPFNHEVIIQGDIHTPYSLLFKILYTCSQSEFYKLRLLTISVGEIEK
jgi:biopolymer transport protein ExbD